MFKIAFFLFFNFLSTIALYAQYDVLHLSIEQDIYFPEDTVVISTSFLSSSQSSTTVAANLIDSKGAIIESYYLALKNNMPKTSQFTLPRILIPGWYFIKVEAPSYDCSVIKFLVLDPNLDSDVSSFQNSDELYYFTEGKNKLLYDLPNTLYVRFNLGGAKGPPEKIGIRDDRGKVLLSRHTKENAFEKLVFTPDSLRTYFIEATYADQSTSSKQIAKNRFSAKGSIMNISFVDEKSILVKLRAKQLSLLGTKLVVLYKSQVLLSKSLSTDELELNIDLNSFSQNLLRFVLLDKYNNVLNERVVFNRLATSQLARKPIIKSSSTINKGERVNIEIDLSDVVKDDFDNIQVVVKVIDKNQSLSSSIQAENIDLNQFSTLTYFFPEAIEAISKASASSKQIDAFFAVNKFITDPRSHNLKEPQSVTHNGFSIRGKLLDSLNQPIAFTPIVITIPAIEGSITYVNTEKDGSFMFNNISFSGTQKVHLTPLFPNKEKKYKVELDNALIGLNTMGCTSFYSTKSWDAMLSAFHLKQNINNTFKEPLITNESLLIVELSNEVKPVLKEVNFDLRLTKYDVLEDMTKFINWVVPHVNVRKGQIFVFSQELGRLLNKPAMLLLDGVPYFNPEKLLLVDPIRFSRIQVVSELSKMQRLGVLGSYGTVAFYTSKGFEIENNSSQVKYINGFRNHDVETELNFIKNDNRIPYLPSNFIFSTQKRPDSSGKLNLNFLAPDIITEIIISVELIERGKTIFASKVIKIEK